MFVLFTFLSLSVSWASSGCCWSGCCWSIFVFLQDTVIETAEKYEFLRFQIFVSFIKDLCIIKV